MDSPLDLSVLLCFLVILCTNNQLLRSACWAVYVTGLLQKNLNNDCYGSSLSCMGLLFIVTKSLDVILEDGVQAII